jgi:sterol 14alpha-demethylase
MKAAEPIPELGGGLPLLGQAIEFRRNPVELIRRGRARWGDVFSIRLFGRRVNVLTGAAANEAFFKAPDHVLSAKEAYQFTVPIFGKGVAYDVSSEMMDEQLRLVHPALRDEKMQSYASFMAAEADAYLDNWGEAGETDLLAAMNEITIAIAARCLIGVEFRQMLSTEFPRLYHDLEGGINVVAFFAPDFPLPAMRRRDRARRRVAELISELIALRRARAAASDDFLDTLMAARTSDGQPLAEDTITGLLLTLLFAGQHTSAVLATWTGILLLQNPQFLPEVLAEQAAVLDTRGMSLAALKQLVSLERCIKEAERLHPPLIMLMRKALMPFSIGDHVVPAGDLAMVSPAVSHLIPEIFADPAQYDPGRFAPPRDEDRRTPYGLIGFGGGKHRCIGLAFAYQQVKVIWSRLLNRYELALVAPVQRPNYATFVVGPRQPCLIRYRRRERLAPSALRSERHSAIGARDEVT